MHRFGRCRVALLAGEWIETIVHFIHALFSKVSGGLAHPVAKRAPAIKAGALSVWCL